MKFNPLLSCGLVHPYHLRELISSFIFTLTVHVFCIEIPVSIQCTPDQTLLSAASDLGPVVQSIVSLTSSLGGQLIKCFMTL